MTFFQITRCATSSTSCAIRSSFFMSAGFKTLFLALLDAGSETLLMFHLTWYIQPGWPTPIWSQRTSCSPLPTGRFRTTLESARTFEKSKAQRWEKLRYYNVSSKSLRCAWLTLGRPPLTGNTTARWCLQDTTGSFVILSHQFRFQSFLWPTNFILQTWWSPGHPKSSWSWVGHNHVTFGA